MGSRRVTTSQRSALVADLRRACNDGDLRPGQMLPTNRELQEKYGLSPKTVTVALQELVAEGLLRTEPRVGVFVTDLARGKAGMYLIVVAPSNMPDLRPRLDMERLRLGFEERVTRLGGSSLVVDPAVARQHVGDSDMPPLAGLFAVTSDPEVDIDLGVDRSLPRVRVSPNPISRRSAGMVVDTVHMDNVDGGRLACRHLLQHGHRSIAFLGLHPVDGDAPLYRWSALREQGWREAMRQVDEPVDDMAFVPTTAPESSGRDEIVAAQAAAEPIVRRRDITAVVCANDSAAIGLLAAMRAAGVPPRSWPSLVGFDGLPEARPSVLTSMRLPWEDIGKTAAQCLWDRAFGGVTGGPRHLELPMTLVSRVGLQKNWSTQLTAEALTKISSGPATTAQ